IYKPYIMNIDIRKLEIFCRVVELGSFSEAASSLHMAQPAVSIAVRKLEDAMEVPLLDRSGRQVRPTAEGKRLQQRALGILNDMKALKQDTLAMAGLLQGELNIACPSMVATYFLPDLLGDFLAEHPGLRASIIQAGTARTEEMLREDAVELGVITQQADNQQPDLELVPLVRQPVVICVPENHPWAGRDTLPIAELDDSPMAVYESGYFIRSHLDERCAAVDVTPDYRLQSNFLPLLLRMVRKGLGSTVALGILPEQEPDLVGIPLSPPSDIHVALAKRRGRTISRANQAFLDWAAIKL
ncbi:MAG: LysR family transcriptional regulator, partial [Pseudomonadota bacterium]